MAKISSLTDNTNDIVYPQTKANAVIMEDSSTVENAVNQRPKLILSASEPTGVVPENTLYGVFGDVGQITTGEIADSAVTTAKIASSAVTDTKLATNAVTTDKIASTAVTTAKIANGAVTGVTNTATSIGTAKLALNTVGTPNLRNASVTSDKIDWTTMGPGKLIYSYRQNAQSSSNTNIDVPLDLDTYSRIQIYFGFEASNTSMTWNSCSALNSSKGIINTTQKGFEFNPNWATISRDTTEVIAGGSSSSNSTSGFIDIVRGHTINYPVFYAWSFGGGDGYGQVIFGRIKTAAKNVKYIRVPFKTPQVGGHVEAYGFI